MHECIDSTLSTTSTTRSTITTDPFANYTPSCITKTDGSFTWRNPRSCKNPPIVPEQESCFQSWSKWVQKGDPSDYKTIIKNATIPPPTVYGWETIKSFGDNITYQDCTGITRMSFKSQPTTNITSSFSVTVWEEVFPVQAPGIQWKNSELRNSWMSHKPHCTFRDEVRDFYCYKLDMEAQLGSDTYTKGHASNAPQSLCPMQSRCRPLIEEVVLLYWPKDITSLQKCDSVRYNSSILDRIGRIDSVTTTSIVITKHAITFRGRDLYLRSINGQELGQYYDKHQEYFGIKDVDDEYGPYTNLAPDAELDRLDPSVMTGTWVFTYPTVYLAHRPIYVKTAYFERNTGAFLQNHATQLRPEGVIGMKSEDVLTVRTKYDSMKDEDYARLVANGSYSFTRSKWWESASQILPLNFDDLQDPVPARSYYDARMDCWGLQSHCATITDGAFRPKLRLARSVWVSIFSEYPCEEGMVVDPPISLRVIDDTSIGQASTHAVLAIPTPHLPPNSPNSPYDGRNSPQRPQPGPSVDDHRPVETDAPSNYWPPATGPPKADKQPASKTGGGRFHDIISVFSSLFFPSGLPQPENGLQGAMNPRKGSNGGSPTIPKWAPRPKNGGPMAGSNGETSQVYEGLASRPRRSSICILTFIIILVLITWP
jgi:hypothetical protein